MENNRDTTIKIEEMIKTQFWYPTDQNSNSPAKATNRSNFSIRIMVRELNYTTISLVLDSWEKVRRTKDFETKVGIILFQQ